MSRKLAAPRKNGSSATVTANNSRSEARSSQRSHSHGAGQDSDEDATLNEMMGKFDESYVYEKETDILR